MPEVFDKDAAPDSGDICVLVAPDLGDADPLEVDDLESSPTESGYIIALAIVRGVRGAGAATVTAGLSSILRLTAPVPLSSVKSAPVKLGSIPKDFFPRPIHSTTAERLITHLSSLDGNVSTWLDAVLGPPREFSSAVNQARAEAKDAVRLAAQFADMELPDDAFVTSPVTADVESETLLSTLLNDGYEGDLEEELLPLDLQRFNGKWIAKQTAASVAHFVDKRERSRLVVVSVNKKPIELIMGVDLLYWDLTHDAFTFVQYKRLERVAPTKRTDPKEWAYVRETELVKQLKLMPAGRRAPSLAADWRAFDTPFWFKFVRGDAAAHLDDKTLKGMHVPADWLRLAIKEGVLKTGPNGGFRVTYNNAKYLGRTAFTQLISRGFVGTSRLGSKAFKKALRSGKRELILAVRKSWEDDEVAGSQPSGTLAEGTPRPATVPEVPF